MKIYVSHDTSEFIDFDILICMYVILSRGSFRFNLADAQLDRLYIGLFSALMRYEFEFSTRLIRRRANPRCVVKSINLSQTNTLLLDETASI